MITNNDIADAVAKLMEEAFPGEKLYRDFVPTGFERPSNLLQLLDGKAHPNFSCGMVEIRPRFMLSTFVPVDPYDHGDAMELTRRQMLLLGLFLPGYVRVKDRAPHVLDEILMESDLDAASIMGLFLPGYIKVKDRAPHVLDEMELENDLDAASIIVPFSYTLDRQDFMELQQQPDMLELHIRQEVNTHG